MNEFAVICGRIEVTMKKILSILIILIMMLSLGACNNKNNTDDDTSVDVYYIDTKTLGLVSEKYELIGTEKEEQIYELLHMLINTPENPMYKSVLPAKITNTTSLSDDNTLTIDFDSSYKELTGVEEVLCRAAIVKTLSQINQVDFVQINVSGSPLIDSNGKAVKKMTAEDFIDDTGTNTIYKVKLYFADKKGNSLVGYDTEINNNGSSSLEELVIERLINGPIETGMYNTIPEGTVLLNISTKDGICTVDFNEKFLEKIPDIDEEVTIYSVVNTLVKLPDISKVQFTINSEVVETFWEDLELDGLFERNLNIISKAE